MSSATIRRAGWCGLGDVREAIDQTIRISGNLPPERALTAPGRARPTKQHEIATQRNHVNEEVLTTKGTGLSASTA